MSPRVISSRIRRMTGMWRMLWPTYRRVPVSWAVRRIASQSSMEMARGFSTKTGRPACSAWRARSAWVWSGVRSRSASRPGWRSSARWSAKVSAPGKRRPAYASASGSGSATAVTRAPYPGRWAVRARSPRSPKPMTPRRRSSVMRCLQRLPDSMVGGVRDQGTRGGGGRGPTVSRLPSPPHENTAGRAARTVDHRGGERVPRAPIARINARC